MSDTNSSDESATRLSLLLRVRDLSDSSAWNAFVDCYAPRVFGWCEQMGLQDADAADAAQAVLLKLVSAMRDFEYSPGKGRFRGWLKTVTRNVAIDCSREWKMRSLESTPGAIAPPLANGCDPAEALYMQLDSARQEELLRLAIQRVQPRFEPRNWRAYELTCREGASALQAARDLGMAVADVYVAKSRILKSLRQEVDRLSEVFE